MKYVDLTHLVAGKLVALNYIKRNGKKLSLPNIRCAAAGAFPINSIGSEISWLKKKNQIESCKEAAFLETMNVLTENRFSARKLMTNFFLDFGCRRYKKLNFVSWSIIRERHDSG